ncbi:MAG: polymer-forming cytoskeletal protein [Deltaproteobacteria bacterium]|nr:polymer-forming cytoskeletal protein [Deltaproteobacteria bacterium]MBW1954438.1 polymer-forming cytoskeletal protein [Deltaproteobacteria bacterium]MBW2041462.1 polymer-forming cytoskeletal protein [Deltaproteobacteria bacterium]MBW2131647.1 polymer-forming cytoskeletal protein [Deltaproteobacteria bacterium]
MFDRKKALKPEEGAESAMGKTEDKPATVPVAGREGKTIIGEQITIEGDIRGHENLVIEGAMKGKIALEKHQVTVGSKGRVEGEIHADNVTISGQLVGNIMASGKVKITKEADFSGEIKAKSISVEDGAYLKAVIELEKETKKQPVPAIGKAREETKPPIPPSVAAGKAS